MSRALRSDFAPARRAMGLDTGASTTQIVPVILGSAERGNRHQRAARARPAFGPPRIRPPTVPAGTARLRLAFTAAHQESDIDRLLAALSTEDAPRRARAV